MSVRRTSLHLVILAALLAACAATGAAATLERGTVVEFTANASYLTMGANYTFSNITVHGDAVTFDGKNVSVLSNSSAKRVNATLHAYQPNASLADGTTLATIEAAFASPATVTFRFTGIPDPGSGSYDIRQDGADIASDGDGGSVAFTTTDPAAHNYSVVYVAATDDGTTDEEEPTGGGSSSSGGAPTPGVWRTGHVWAGAPQTTFRLTTRTLPGMAGIAIRTGQARAGVSIDITQTNTLPADLPPLDAVYSHLDIRFEGVAEADIAETVLDVRVNASFARQYEDIVVSRYTGAWTDLPTRLLNDSGDRWVYRANSSGFSSFAVRGVAAEDNVSEPFCGDGTCDANETWETCPADCETPAAVVAARDAIQDANGTIRPGDPGYDLLQQAQQAFDAGNYTAAERLAGDAVDAYRAAPQVPVLPVAAGLVVLLLLIVTVLRYRRWRHLRVRDRVNEVARRIRSDLDRMAPADTGRAQALLDRAAAAVEAQDYPAAERRLREIQDLLQGGKSETGED